MTDKYSHMNPNQLMWFESAMFLVGSCSVCHILASGTTLKASRRWDLVCRSRSQGAWRISLGQLRVLDADSTFWFANNCPLILLRPWMKPSLLLSLPWWIQIPWSCEPNQACSPLSYFCQIFAHRQAKSNWHMRLEQPPQRRTWYRLYTKTAQCMFMNNQVRLIQVSLVAAVVGCRIPAGVKVCRCSSPSCETEYLHIAYACASCAFQSLLDYLWYIMRCKCYVNSCYTVLFREQWQERKVCQ